MGWGEYWSKNWGGEITANRRYIEQDDRYDVIPRVQNTASRTINNARTIQEWIVVT